MDGTEHEQWLATLKVGEEVTYYNRFHGDVITKIVHITPKLQIKTENGYVFKGGRCRIDSWTSYTIRPVTQDVIDRVHKRNLIARLENKLSLQKLSIKQLQRIESIISEEEKTHA